MITIAAANALHIPLPDKSVQCVVTSPPYWGLRDYGTAKWEGGSAECDHRQPGTKTGSSTTLRNDGREHTGPYENERALTVGYPYRDTCAKCGARRIDAQIGLEATPAEYVAHIVAVMRECWRVLKDDGVMWLNLGDSYSSDTKGANNNGESGITLTSGARPHVRAAYNDGRGRTARKVDTGLKPKDLVGIPWRVAFALQDDGWYLRSDIIWAKPNPMPESVTDRPTKAHEYVFLLTKQARYYYDAEAIKESDAGITGGRQRAALNGNSKYVGAMHRDASRTDSASLEMNMPGNGRNRRSVWTVATQPYSGAHFATFPPKLIEPMILAGTSARGECPHCGKAWVRVVERESETFDEARKNRAKIGDRKIYHDGRKPSVSNGRPENSGIGYSSNNTIGWRPQCECRDLAICTADHSQDCLLCNNSGFVPMIPEPIPQSVLDFFAGSGTTGAIAVKHGRRAVLFDLNTKYIDLQFERTNGVQMVMPT